MSTRRWNCIQQVFRFKPLLAEQSGLVATRTVAQDRDDRMARSQATRDVTGCDHVQPGRGSDENACTDVNTIINTLKLL